MSKETRKPGSAPTRKFEEERLSANIVSLEQGQTLHGIYDGVEIMTDAEGNPKMSKLNSDQPIEIAKFRDLDDETPFAIWANAGLKGAFSFFKVKPGMAIKVTSKGKIDHPTIAGQTVNQYEIVGLKAV